MHPEYLEHTGTPHDGVIPHSGRFPYGSGENPYQRAANFVANVNKLSNEGLTLSEIAAGQGMTTAELKSKMTISSGMAKAYRNGRILELHERGWSNTAIGEKLGCSEGTVRNALKDPEKAIQNKNQQVMDLLMSQVEKKEFLDVGEGVNYQIGVSQTRLNNCLKELERQGYKVHNVYVPRATDPSKRPVTKVLAKEDADYQEMYKHMDKILSIEGEYISPEGLRKTVKDYVSIDPKRVKIRYGEEGGITKDGVIEIRPGVKDLALGNNSYAQVRIAVGGTHYLKGMAVYGENFPKGVDIIFNTNKDKSVPMMSDDSNNTVLKQLKMGKDLPFGSVVRQTEYTDSNGVSHQSAINIVNDDSDWEKWSKTLPSQMVSKQPISFAKKVLKDTYDDKKREFDEINSYTNNAIKKVLLREFADSCDSDAVNLKAKGLPGQKSQVILPVDTLKETEIFAPNYKNGEEVVLIRYPHAGQFEIPRLTVNNKNKEALQRIGADAKSAVGINHKVAEQLSGADFDGDTVTVIPTKNQPIKNQKYLKELENFDPKVVYKAYEGMPKVSDSSFDTQKEMGIVSNLITDMTLKGADFKEIARAVKHSMVVIDAEKHNLDYKRSYVENDIQALKNAYQDGGGASTLISRAKRDDRNVPERKEITAMYLMTEKEKKDYLNGKKIYRETGRTYIDDKGREKKAMQNHPIPTEMEITDDAYTLSSGTKMENLYADYANKMKALANESRKAMLATPNMKYNAVAAKTYKEEVASLKDKHEIAIRNRPKERQAQRVANVIVQTKLKDNPELKNDKDQLKKIRSQAIDVARERLNPNAKEYRIHLTDREWEAIQSGAIHHDKLTDMLKYMDSDEVKKRATPRTSTGLSAAQISRARSLRNSGYTWAEIADRLGVSAATIRKNIDS